jgi:hypothetical protein
VSIVEGSVGLLEQQELLEVPPARRLIVPRGHRAWWGVDPGVQRVAIAAVTTDASPQPVYRTATASFAPMEGGARLEAIWTDTRRFVAGLLEGGWPPPGIVLVEQPSGSQPNPPLSYATGVIMGAVFAGVRQALPGRSVRTETMTSGEWKKTATGYGGWKKTVKPYGVLRWANANGYAGASYDEADAMGLAEAARRTVALEER